MMIMENQWKIKGKSMENQWKSMEINRNQWKSVEIH